MSWHRSSPSHSAAPSGSLSPARPARPRRGWVATLLLGVVLAGLTVPMGNETVASSTADRTVASWSHNYQVSTADENSSRIAYSGTWKTALSSGYFGGKAKAARSRGAKATLTVTGTALAWIGPTGPTRGKASVFLDGKWIKSVNMYASSYHARTIVFVMPLNPSSSHKVAIVAQGTAGHPTIAIDRFVIRGAPKPSTSPGGSSSGAIKVTSDNVTIDGKTIVGSGSGSGIRAHGTASNPIDNLTIRNCVIRGFTIGIDLAYVRNVTIENCVIDNSRYAGIMVVSGLGGRISHNLIRKVAYHTSLATSFQNNAYGIALSRYASTNFTSNPRTADFVVSGNTIEDVPYWHCFDTHAAQRITFSGNTTRRCPRAYFITSDSLNYPSRNVTITGNRLEQALQVTGGTNRKAITLVNLQTGSVTNNKVSTTYGTPYVYDYKGVDPAGSVNVTISGQTSIP